MAAPAVAQASVTACEPAKVAPSSGVKVGVATVLAGIASYAPMSTALPWMRAAPARSVPGGAEPSAPASRQGDAGASV